MPSCLYTDDIEHSNPRVIHSSSKLYTRHEQSRASGLQPLHALAVPAVQIQRSWVQRQATVPAGASKFPPSFERPQQNSWECFKWPHVVSGRGTRLAQSQVACPASLHRRLTLVFSAYSTGSTAPAQVGGRLVGSASSF